MNIKYEGLKMSRILFKNRVLHLLTIMCLGLFFCEIDAAGTMRNMTSMQIVADMKAGWNLGNTLDAWANGVSGLSTETCWSNPKATKALFDALKAKGFNTVKIPVTWRDHIGASPAFTIDKAWMDRVEEVVNYALNDKYVRCS